MYSYHHVLPRLPVNLSKGNTSQQLTLRSSPYFGTCSLARIRLGLPFYDSLFDTWQLVLCNFLSVSGKLDSCFLPERMMILQCAVDGGGAEAGGVELDGGIRRVEYCDVNCDVRQHACQLMPSGHRGLRTKIIN